MVDETSLWEIDDDVGDNNEVGENVILVVVILVAWVFKWESESTENSDNMDEDCALEIVKNAEFWWIAKRPAGEAMGYSS